MPSLVQSRKRPAATNETSRAEGDGRRRRSTASRQRIVEAILELAREGAAAPGAEAVAERAGVGRRTVFRLFKDMESLYVEMHQTMLGRIEGILTQPIEGRTWRQRLDQLIDRRVELFEEVMAIKAAADAHRHRSQFLQSSHEEMQRMLRELLLFVLPKSVKQDTIALEALDAALSLETWRRLRQDQRLSVKAATAVLKRLAEVATG